MHDLIGGVIDLRPVHRDQQYAIVRPLEKQAMVAPIVHRSGSLIAGPDRSRDDGMIA
jgi:hypothetical protein